MKLLPPFSKPYLSEVLLISTLTLQALYRGMLWENKRISDSEPMLHLFSLSDLHPKLLTELHFHRNSCGKHKKKGYQRLARENHNLRNKDLVLQVGKNPECISFSQAACDDI